MALNFWIGVSMMVSQKLKFYFDFLTLISFQTCNDLLCKAKKYIFYVAQKNESHTGLKLHEAA